MQARVSTQRIPLFRLETATAIIVAIILGLLAFALTMPRGAHAQQGATVFIPMVSVNPGPRGADEGAVIPGRYIVVLADAYVSGTNPAGYSVAEQARTLTDVYGGEVIYTYDAALSGFAAELSESSAAAVAADPAVALVEPDRVIQIDATQSNPTWGLDRVDQRTLPLSKSYLYNTNGAGVHAYIVDTGVRVTHNEFVGRIGDGFTAINDGRGVVDCNGHGTHVAGTVGGTTYGVAKGVVIHPVRVLNCEGSGSTSTVIAGIDWITRNHQKPAVANMSLSGGGSSTLDTAVRNSMAAGVVYVAAAGNANTNACNYSPARVGEVLTVGATTSNDSRASFSNFGTCVDLFAPGSGITSATAGSDSSTGGYSGTSMAAPHVAGAVALYLAYNPAASPAQVHAAVVNTATLDRVVSPGAGSPNRLLYTLDLQGAPQPAPTNTPLPAPTATALPTATPMPTATPTTAPTATPTSAPTQPAPTATPAPPPAPAPAPLCTDLIVDGDFEGNGSAWTQSSTQGFPIICSDGTCGSSLEPYSGNRLAWLGGANQERSLLSQTVVVPSKQTAILNYWTRIESEDSCGYDYGYVNVRVGNSSKTVQRLPLCRPYNTNGWVQQSVNLSQYAGKTVRVEFFVSTDVWNVSSLFIDDVALVLTNTCTASATSDAMGPVIVPAMPLDEDFDETTGFTPMAGETERAFAAPEGPIIWQR